MSLEDLKEKKATGENSMAADPVTGEGGPVKKRRADLKKKVPDGKMEKVSDVGMKEEAELEEAFTALFEGADLSEDFKTKAIAVFEAAIHQKVEAKREALEEEFAANLEEQVTEAVDTLSEKVDSYLNYVVENWMEANEVAIESAFKVEVAESVLESVKGIIWEHNLDMSEGESEAIAVVEARLEEANEKNNELVEEILALREEKENFELEAAFVEITEGLAETQADKLKTLSEGISYKSIEDYQTKLVALKENYFAESKNTAGDETEFLNEEVEAEENSPILDEAVNYYVKAFRKNFPK